MSSNTLTRIACAAALTAALALAGCGEKPQTAGAKPRADAKAWQGAAEAGPYTTSGWKAGDQASWEAQMRARTQNQNEYQRAPAAAK